MAVNTQTAEERIKKLTLDDKKEVHGTSLVIAAIHIDFNFIS